MLRVGYPAVLPAELLSGFPKEVELIPLTNEMDQTMDIDVWIPDPYPTRARKVWPNLRGVRLVLAMLAGTEWIPEVVGPHVTICNAKGAHNVSTAEWTLASILATLKYFPFYGQMQQAGLWKLRYKASEHYAAMTGDTRPIYPPVMLEELTGKTVLLAGYGSIGKDIEKMLEPFHLNLLRVARSARSDPKVHAIAELDSLIPQAEVIILIVPSTAETRCLIGPRQFGLMQQGALLVNAARGPVVDTDALVAALQAGKIRAAVDVTEPEPLPEGHPLWSCPNLLITPHIGGSSPHFSRNAMRVAAAELHRYIAAEPLQNVVQAAV